MAYKPEEENKAFRSAKTDYIDFNTTTTVSPQEGRQHWNSEDGTILKIGDQIGFRLYRDPSDTDDTYPDDAVVAFSFGYHYQVDFLGSKNIATK